jgi:hypothetical protein
MSEELKELEASETLSEIRKRTRDARQAELQALHKIADAAKAFCDTNVMSYIMETGLVLGPKKIERINLTADLEAALKEYEALKK